MEPEVQTKISEFFNQYNKVYYEPSTIIISPEESIKHAYCLIEGTVRMLSNTENGRELVINVFKPTSFFPVGSIINQTPVRYYYESITDVVLFASPVDSFEQFLKDEPSVTFDLLKRIYKGLDGYFLRVESLMLGEAYLKTVAQLVINIRRFGNKLNITQNEIANLTGLSRETVTREIALLKEKGILSYEGETLVISNPEKLEQELKI